MYLHNQLTLADTPMQLKGQALVPKVCQQTGNQHYAGRSTDCREAATGRALELCAFRSFPRALIRNALSSWCNSLVGPARPQSRTCGTSHCPPTKSKCFLCRIPHMLLLRATTSTSTKLCTATLFALARLHLCRYGSATRYPVVRQLQVTGQLHLFPLHFLFQLPARRFGSPIPSSVRHVSRRAAKLRCDAVITGGQFIRCYLYPRPKHAGMVAGRLEGLLAGSSVPPPQCRSTKQIFSRRDGVSRKRTMKKSSQTGLARNARKPKETRLLRHCRRRYSRAHLRRWWRWKGKIVARSTV